MRSGEFIKQPANFAAFIPTSLPFHPPVNMDDALVQLLSRADRALGRLDGMATVLPNPDLFVAMYVRHEAVLSSQIEGTESTLEDVLQFEVKAGKERVKDVEEVVNYVEALNYGLERLEELPLSLRLIREIHAHLLHNVRGANRTPGEFRTSQNWIGAAGSTPANATYVPPPVPEMHTALDNFEKFLHTDADLPDLVHCGIAHAQFETIHPFLDGNGRVGRLLITFLLCQKEILRRPLLYLSLYLRAHRAEYYDRLMAIRLDGNWEGWLKFFLKGVFEVSQSATETAQAILKLRDNHRAIVAETMERRSPMGLRLLDLLFMQPIIYVPVAATRLECSYVTANRIIGQMEALGILRETTGGQRNRRFRYQPYLDLFDRLAIDEQDEPETPGR